MPNRVETPKSEQSARTIPLRPVVADALFEHRARTAASGDDDYIDLAGVAFRDEALIAEQG